MFNDPGSLQSAVVGDGTGFIEVIVAADLCLEVISTVKFRISPIVCSACRASCLWSARQDGTHGLQR